jgi:hypothetical protein
MAFDLNMLATSAVEQIASFAVSHRDETFYAFAIDRTLLCLNSEEAFQEEVQRLERRYPDGREIAEQQRMNTGDWAYQGFGALEGQGRFPFGDTSSPDFLAAHKAAMELVLAELDRRDAFNCLRRSPDFITFVVDDTVG